MPRITRTTTTNSSTNTATASPLLVAMSSSITKDHFSCDPSYGAGSASCDRQRVMSIVRVAFSTCRRLAHTPTRDHV